MMATTEQQDVNDMHGNDDLFELYALGRLDRSVLADCRPCGKVRRL